MFVRNCVVCVFLQTDLKLYPTQVFSYVQVLRLYLFEKKKCAFFKAFSFRFENGNIIVLTFLSNIALYKFNHLTAFVSMVYAMLLAPIF